MERLLIIAFSLSLIVLQINCKPTFNKIPTINSVERLDENTLKLSWTIDHSSETLSRYRILFARDGAGDRLFEWPAQINRIDNDVVGTTYRSSLYKNAFECYKKCVINPMCIFAAFRTFSNKLAQDAQTTCLMKSKLDKSVANGLLTSNTSNNNNIATEYIEIADYQSEAILNGVPTHISYSFSVLVYDRELDDWSEESEIYEYKPPKLDSKLEYEFRNGHVFSWSQPKSGADMFTISRYNLVLWEDDDLNKREKISIKDEIKSFKFNLDYYNDDISPVYAASENECFQLCIEQANCVRYAFSTATNDCHLMGKFDLTNCKLLPKNSVVYSLRRDSNEFRVRNLKPKTSYNAHLEFLTPYGFIGRSNILKFETGEFFNVDEEPEQERETRAPTKQAAVTTKASEEKPPIVEEVDEYFVIPGSGGSSSENEKPEPEIDSEYPGSGGESVIGGGGDNESGETDVDKTTLEINLESSQTKRVNERFEIECTFRGSSKKDIIWTKKGDRFKFLKTEISRSNGDAEKSVTNKLIFDSLTRKDDGTYTCYSEDRPEDSIDLVLNVKNVPSKPVIKKATASEKTGAVIGWELEDNGGLDPIKGIIEISQDFQDSSSLIEGIELNNEDLKQKEVQIDVDANIKKGSFVRLSIENAVGTSEKSDEFRVIDADIPIVPQQEVTEILSPAGIILGEETTSSPLSVESSTPHQNQPSSPAAIKVDTAAATKAAEMIINQKPKAFSFLLMVAAILFLVIIAYAVYRCKFANKSDDNQATAKENEKPEQADENKTLVDNKEEK